MKKCSKVLFIFVLFLITAVSNPIYVLGFTVDTTLISNSRKSLYEQILGKCNDSGNVIFGSLSSNGYQYTYKADNNSFSVRYMVKESNWTKTISFSYDYDTNIVTSNFQQVKGSLYYAANATFKADEYINSNSINYKDATGGDYGSMCVSYAEIFAEKAIPKINKKMMQEFGVSLCKIGFISYEHSHNGGTSTCTLRALCEVCGNEYGELGKHDAELKNQVDATCYNTGYTGDYICKNCKVIIEHGEITPIIEKSTATGKYDLLKQYILKNGKIDSANNKYIEYTDVIESVNTYARITYIDELAEFELLSVYESNTGSSNTSINIKENGSETVTVNYTYEYVGLYAQSLITVDEYTKNSKLSFEKTKNSVFSNEQIQNLCNADLKSSFIAWDLLLLEHLQLDINMGNLGFISYEESATHTWDKGNISKKETCINDGEKLYKCKVCNETKTECIKAIGHSYNGEICIVCGHSKSTIISTTEPVTQPMVKPTEPVTQPVVKPTEPVTQPMVKPTEPVTQPVVKPTEPVTQPVVKPTTESTTKPVVKPTESITKPTDIIDTSIAPTELEYETETYNENNFLDNKTQSNKSKNAPNNIWIAIAIVATLLVITITVVMFISHKKLNKK